MRDLLKACIEGYSKEKYWLRRQKIFEGKCNKCLKYLYHSYIRRTETLHNASIGLYLNGGGTIFGDIPDLPHGLNGIVINDKAVIGKNCTIYHQVTIGEIGGNAPIIGNNCFIGPGAKILGGVRVGNNVTIGANCVVVKDIPDGSTVVVKEPRIILKDN